MFGTDGVRGVANTELTAEIAYSLGRAGAYVLTEGTHKPKILVAKDTRVSGDMLEAALVAGILSVGAEAVLLGVVPTPAVAYLTRKYNADAGVMISASHNPVQDNGIKFFDNRGYKLEDSIEEKINNMPYVAESLIVERDKRLYALIAVAENTDGMSKEEILATMEQNRKDLNAQLPAYSQVLGVEIMEQGFEHTPKRSIKRFLYK